MIRKGRVNLVTAQGRDRNKKRPCKFGDRTRGDRVRKGRERMVTVKGRDLCLRRHKIVSMPSRGIIITIKTGVADKAGRPTSCNSDIHLRVWGTVLIKGHPQVRPARGGTSVNGHRSLRLGFLLHNRSH